MTPPFPGILIVAADSREGERIASVLEAAGMVTVDASTTPCRLADMRGCAAVVVALPDNALREFLWSASTEAPETKFLLVMDPGAEPIEDERIVGVRRPLVPRELIGAALDLILRDAQVGMAAELGIASAKLACLSMRERAAAPAPVRC